MREEMREEIAPSCLASSWVGMGRRAKKCAVGCLTVVVIVIFSVAMSAYVHLGPDDQVLIKTPKGKRVVNAPGGGQLNPSTLGSAARPP